MKKCISLFICFVSVLYCKAQTIETAIEEYLNMLNQPKIYSLQGNPVDADINLIGKGLVFCVKKLNIESNTFTSFCVIFDDYRDSYIDFGRMDFDLTYGSGIISIFFEDVDGDNEKEIIVIYESGGRTYYTPHGGYAGIKNQYQTRVFKYHKEGGINFTTEYRIIGDLLTVNLPIETGAFSEESLIGREDNENKLKEILGVTYNASQVKKRIKLLKENGLLRSN